MSELVYSGPLEKLPNEAAEAVMVAFMAMLAATDFDRDQSGNDDLEIINGEAALVRPFSKHASVRLFHNA